MNVFARALSAIVLMSIVSQAHAEDIGWRGLLAAEDLGWNVWEFKTSDLNDDGL